MKTIIKFTTVIGGTPYSMQLDLVVAYGTQFSKERKNQVSKRTLDGNLYCYDNGVTVTYGELVLKYLTPTQFALLEDFITEKTLFNKRPFAMELVNSDADIDLGRGRGVSLTKVNWGDDFINTEGVFEHKAPDLYDARIPYSFVEELQ